MDFANSILDWYYKNKRDLPWRSSNDPYKIWLSEIILQQTRVDQGLPYYHRFIKKYPTIKKLAAADEHDVLKLWQGLGYYSRARNLHHAAKDVMKRFAGKFPTTYEDIHSLKGVGDYTAAAITSFAFNQPYAVVDGNVYRLLSRYFGIKTPINSTKGKKQFDKVASEMIKSLKNNIDKPNFTTDKDSNILYKDYNQAIMEFGALQCKPSNPDCKVCCLTNSCFASAKKKTDSLPVKIKSVKIRSRHFYYFVIKEKNKVHLKKRISNDIWKNLYDFPLIESKQRLTAGKLLKEIKGIVGKTDLNVLKSSNVFKHQLSHQTIYATFLEIEVQQKLRLQGTEKVKTELLHLYPVPKLIENYLETR